MAQLQCTVADSSLLGTASVCVCPACFAHNHAVLILEGVLMSHFELLPLCPVHVVMQADPAQARGRCNALEISQTGLVVLFCHLGRFVAFGCTMKLLEEFDLMMTMLWC